MAYQRFRVLATTALLGGGLLMAANPAPADIPGVTVTVNAKAGLATVPGTALGINHAVWDQELGTDAVADLLGAAGVGMLRYPGGSYGDIYHWVDNTAPGGFVAPNTDFDHFMAGAVLTTAANWPDGVVAGGDAATWNQTVLSIAGPHIDFVILHWYPGGA